MHIAVVGASGFVGHGLMSRLAEMPSSRGCVVGFARTPDPARQIRGVGDFVQADWETLLAGSDAVIHCAALAHVPWVDSPEARERVWMQNVCLAEQVLSGARKAGVRQFVYLSSAKVYGERSPENGFSEDSALLPEDAYGFSKKMAEQRLQRQAGELALLILRLPLVYGPGAKGNLRALMCWLQAGRPLPFRTLRNQRSLLGLDLLSRVVERALAIGLSGTFNVADPRPISTAELGLALQSELGGDVWPFPSSILRAAAAIAGRDAVAQRLTDSLVLDTRRIQAQCADLFTHVDTRAGLVSMAADHRISFASPTSFR